MSVGRASASPRPHRLQPEHRERQPTTRWEPLVLLGAGAWQLICCPWHRWVRRPIPRRLAHHYMRRARAGHGLLPSSTPVDVTHGDRRLSTRTTCASPAAPALSTARAATHSVACSWRNALSDHSWTSSAPEWLTVPQRGLYTGVMILGAVGMRRGSKRTSQGLTVSSRRSPAGPSLQRDSDRPSSPRLTAPARFVDMCD